MDFKIDVPVRGFGQDGEPVLGDHLNATWGRLYLCADCLHQAGRLVGMLDPSQTVAVGEDLVRLEDRVAELEAEVEAERALRVVSFEDVKRLLDGRRRENRSVTA